MEKLPNKVRVTKEEMVEHFIKCRPFVPNDRRVGAFAKHLGYVRQHQMICGQRITFYVKKEALEKC